MMMRMVVVVVVMRMMIMMMMIIIMSIFCIRQHKAKCTTSTATTITLYSWQKWLGRRPCFPSGELQKAVGTGTWSPWCLLSQN